MNLFSRKAPFTLKELALYATLFCMLLLFTLPAAFPGDMQYWLNWYQYMAEHGFSNIYQNPVNNYNPLFHYFLFVFNLFISSPAKIGHYLPFLKVFPLLFDFIGALVAASLINQKHRRFLLSLLFLFNAGYLYNTLIWGQVDAVFTCLSFIAVVLAVKQRPVWSLLFYLLALNAKTQAIIFLPVLLLLWAPLWFRSIKSLGIAVLAAAVLQVLILAPFMWFGKQNNLQAILDINFKAVGFYPYVSVNAYNLWYFLIPDKDLTEVLDSIKFWGKTYKQWGLILFCLFSAISLLPVFLLAVRNVLNRQVFARPDIQLVLLSAGLIPICFCFFNTQMHERYWHPALLFLGAYTLLSRHYSIYIMASIAYFLNLEAVNKYLKLRNYASFIFEPRVVAFLFFMALLIGIWQLYRLAEVKAWFQEIKNSYKTARTRKLVMN